MNLHTLRVSVTSRTAARHPGIQINAGWLPKMGFTPGVLIQIIHVHGEMIVTLCDENIRRYSELYATTKAQGGKLIQISNARYGDTQRPILATCGKAFNKTGFTYGDGLIALYEYGLIRIRHFPDTLKLLYIKGANDKYGGDSIPTLRLCGQWLPEFGFEPNALVTAFPEPGAITLERRSERIEKYSDAVRFARQNKMKLFQVKAESHCGKLIPCITIAGTCLDRANFVLNDALFAFCEQGRIKLQKLDPAELGF